VSKITKDALLGAAPQTTVVKLERLGGEITIKALTRGARKAWMAALQAGDQDAMEILVVESLVEPELTRADVKKLNEVDERVLDEVFNAISDFNGWGGDASTETRRDLLNKVADGEVSVDQALATFR
jgi:hypothetical protein